MVDTPDGNPADKNSAQIEHESNLDGLKPNPKTPENKKETTAKNSGNEENPGNSKQSDISLGESSSNLSEDGSLGKGSSEGDYRQYVIDDLIGQDRSCPSNFFPNKKIR